MLGIVYFDFIGQLFNPRVIIMFGFCLSSFRLRLSQHLGLRLNLVRHVSFQHCFFVAFCLVSHWSGLKLVVK